MGFHLDTTGNVWLGSGSEGDTLSDAITAGPPNFYVTSAGSIFAQAGTVGGITVDSTGIYANYDAGNTGFKIFSSDGSAEFDDVTIRGEIQNTSLTSSMTMSSGGEIKTSSGTSRIEIGNTNETYISFIQGSATTGRIETIAGSGGADTFRISSFLNDDLELYAGGGSGTLEITAGTIYVPTGAAWSFSGNTGTAGQVLTRNNVGGASWQSTSGHNHSGYSFPNSGTLLSDDTHSHNSTNTVLNTNTSFTGMINHIAETVGNSGNAHGLTLTDVLTNDNHSHGAVGNINAITSNYNNNVTAYNTAFSAAGAFNLYNTINSALNNKANNSALHNAHNYFTNADVDGNHHSHNGYLTGNESHFNSASAHGQYVYYNDYLNHISNFNSHKNSNNSHSAAIAAAVNSHYNAYISGHLSSDRRFKTNIIDTNLGLEFINRLQPREFDWTSDYLDDLLDSNDQHAIVARDIYTNIQQGFIVDEVRDAVFEQTGSNNAFSGLTFNPRNKDELDTLDESNPVGYIRPTDFIPPLVKAVQELSAKIELLEARIDELEGV